MGADWTKGFAITLVPPAKILKKTLAAAVAPRLTRDTDLANSCISRRSARDKAFPNSRSSSGSLVEVISSTT